jgi:hypothetical protein
MFPASLLITVGVFMSGYVTLFCLANLRCSLAVYSGVWSSALLPLVRSVSLEVLSGWRVGLYSAVVMRRRGRGRGGGGGGGWLCRYGAGRMLDDG